MKKLMLPLLILCCFGGLGTPVVGFDRAPVPADFQAAIFKRLCADYLPALQNSRLVIVSARDVSHLVAEFQRAQFQVQVVHPNQADQAQASVFYVTAETPHDVICRLQAKNRFLLTDNVDLVNDGWASVGIVPHQNRAGLVANISTLEKSGVAVGLGFFRFVRILDTEVN